MGALKHDSFAFGSMSETLQQLQHASWRMTSGVRFKRG
jgi:hypothetical protein